MVRDDEVIASLYETQEEESIKSLGQRYFTLDSEDLDGGPDDDQSLEGCDRTLRMMSSYGYVYG